jgi:hypothetical protein
VSQRKTREKKYSRFTVRNKQEFRTSWLCLYPTPTPPPSIIQLPSPNDVVDPDDLVIPKNACTRSVSHTHAALDAASFIQTAGLVVGNHLEKEIRRCRMTRFRSSDDRRSTRWASGAHSLASAMSENIPSRPQSGCAPRFGQPHCGAVDRRRSDGGHPRLLSWPGTRRRLALILYIGGHSSPPETHCHLGDKF